MFARYQRAETKADWSDSDDLYEPLIPDNHSCNEPQKDSDALEPRMAPPNGQPATRRDTIPAAPPPNALPPRKSSSLAAVSRHLLAVLALCGVGYGVQKYQMSQSGETEDTAQQYDPFAEWDHVESAPTFQSEQTDTGMTESDPTLNPIPYPVAEQERMQTDLVSLRNQLEETLDQTADQVEQNSRATLDDYLAVTRKPTRRSIWEPPQQQEQSVETIARNLSREPETKLPDPSLKSSTQTNSTSGTGFSQFNPFSDEENSQSDRDTLVSDSNHEVTTKYLTQTEDNDRDIYRQFSIGHGKTRTVFVVDESVSSDLLTFSTIYADLRNRWKNETINPRTIEILVTRQNQTSQGAALQNRLQQLKPDRTIYLSQGTQQQGSLRFSSRSEWSQAKLTSLSRFQLPEMNTSTQTSVYSRNTVNPVVFLELPQLSDEPDAEILQTLQMAVSGKWKPSSINQQFGSSESPSNNQFGYFQEPDEQQEVTNQFQTEITDSDTKRESSDTIAVPNPFDLADKMTDKDKPSSTYFTISEPEQDFSSTQQDEQSYRTTDDYIAGLYNQSQSKQETQGKDAPDNSMNAFNPFQDDKSGEDSTEMRVSVSSPTVEILDAPPIFQPPTSRKPQQKFNGAYDRLPPPPTP